MDNITIDKYTIEPTNADKLFFPESGVTKGDLINYYAKIADVMLPHVQGRPITMHRFPDGLEDEGFFQKSVPDYFPDWIDRVTVDTRTDGEQTMAVCNNAAALVYLANQACITPHIWLSRVDRIDFPDKMVFDLDPTRDDFLPIRAAATELRTILDDELGLTSFLMTTGSKGLHIVVPLDRSADFEDVMSFAQSVAAVATDRHPELFTTEQRIENRNAPIYLDIARNAYGQTSVSPYAVRALSAAPIATPVNWDELGDIISAQTFTIWNIESRLNEVGDPWEGIWNQVCSLDEAQDMLDVLFSEVATGDDMTGIS
ncbi:MAG: non-homologous end-joining DNA ligase [Armatimonadota bacterium]|nr:non-homologous end-joining DNA ligase [bacterium]